MFGDKLKKLRTENNLTQDQLAERLYVTRAAVSKWETGRGYPNIDSLKQLSNLFGISIDQLIADEDVINHNLLEQRKSRVFFRWAMVCLGITFLATLGAAFTQWPYMRFIGLLGMVGYVVCGIFSKPRYKRMALRKYIVPYVISRVVVLVIVLAAAIAMISTL